MPRLASAIIPLMIFAAPALAAPVLTVIGTDNGNSLIFVPLFNTPGTLVGAFVDSDFTQIGVDITGVPSVPSPDLGTVSLQVSGFTGGGNHVLDITARQTGLTQPAGFDGMVTQTFNNLIGAPGPATENFILNGTTINTHTFDVNPPRSDTAMFTDPGLPAITSNAEEFVATFTTAGQDLEMTQEFSALAVPEPRSITLLAMALIGFLAFKRRQAQG